FLFIEQILFCRKRRISHFSISPRPIPKFFVRSRVNSFAIDKYRADDGLVWERIFLPSDAIISEKIVIIRKIHCFVAALRHIPGLVVSLVVKLAVVFDKWEQILREQR